MKEILMKHTTLFFTLMIFVLLTACGGDGKNGAASDNNLLDENTSLPVTIVSIQVSPVDIIVPKGTTGNYIATAYYSDNTVKDVTALATWKSSSSKTVNIIGSGNTAGYAEALAVGKSTVTANFEGLLSNEAHVEVTSIAVHELIVTPFEKRVAIGVNIQYQAIVLYADGTNSDVTAFASFSSSLPRVANIGVNQAGLAKSLSVGVTDITATFQQLSSNTAVLEVTAATVTSLQITPADITVPVGTTGTYTAIAYYSDSTSHDVTSQATWISADTAIVSIVTSGRTAGYAQALHVGSTTVIATFHGQNSNTAKVTVTDAILQSIVISPIVKIVTNGVSVQYSALGRYSDKTVHDLTLFAAWTSSDKAVATIHSGGENAALAQTVNIGTTHIKAAYMGVTSNLALLTVTAATLTSIQVTPAEVTVPAGTQDKFTAIAHYSDGSSYDVTTQATWISNNTAVVSVVPSGEDGGLGHALTHGTANVTASLDGKTSNTAVVTVTGKALTNIHLVPAYTVEIPVGGHKKYKVWAYYDDSTTKDVTVYSTLSIADANIATIETSGIDLGLVKGINIGSTLVQASYKGENDTAPLTVTTATIQSIQVTPTAITVPTGTQINLQQ